jgi:hypothetical protein
MFKKNPDSEIVLDRAIFNTRNFLLTGWLAAFFYLFGFSFFFFCIFLLIAVSILFFRDNVNLVWSDGVRIVTTLVGAIRTEYENLIGTQPSSVKKNESEIASERLDFAKDDNFLTEGGVIDLDPDMERQQQSTYNYKVKVRVENDDHVVAEIDSDSHISLISEEYYEHLVRQNPVEHLPEQPMTFQGLGSTIVSKYPQMMLYIHIGRIRTRNRFIVTSLLKSSPILLGTDFTVNNMVSVAPFRDNEWFVTIGSLDKPHGRVPAYITSKIGLCSPENVFLFTSFIRIHWFTVPPTFQFTVQEDGFDYIVFCFF